MVLGGFGNGGDRHQAVTDTRFALDVVQLGEPREVYRYPTTVGDYSATR